MVTREPGGTAIGEKIRHLLQFAPESSAMTPETELLLFEASRSQLVREVIRPALDRGTVVISDRFADSTTVYQGIARRLDQDMVGHLNTVAVGDCNALDPANCFGSSDFSVGKGPGPRSGSRSRS